MNVRRASGNSRRVTRAAAAAVALFLFSALASVGVLSPSPAHSASPAPVNVVVFMVDDQPTDEIDAMPFTQANIFDSGTYYPNGMIPTSLCCPSRSAFLTGWLANTTGVWTNKQREDGGYTAFRPYEGDTIATALDAAGYHTALVGKYINDFNLIEPDTSYVPAGWDEFLAIQPDIVSADATYYDYRLRGTADNTVHYGTTPEDYSTDVLGDVAANVAASAPPDQPFFLYFAPYAVHPPWTPAPRDKDTWPLEPGSAILGLDEENVSDKPLWVQGLPRVNRHEMRLDLTRQHEMSKALDVAIEKIVAALGDRAADTMFVYVSDNGFMHGAHRLDGKDLPYARSTEIPIAIKWPGLASGVDPRVVTNVDLTATIAEATGIDWNRDGRSTLSTTRDGTVVEQVASNKHPAYCGWRTDRYLFVQYDTGERELYDYQKDPGELHNRIDRPGYAKRIADMRAAAEAACTPVPPGFAW